MNSMENCNVPRFNSCKLIELHLTSGSIFQTQGPDLILKLAEHPDSPGERIHFVNFIFCSKMNIQDFLAVNAIFDLLVSPLGRGFNVQLNPEMGCKISLECQNIVFKAADQQAQGAQASQ